MSYHPTPAGHGDAPLEQIVTVEKDPEIEAIMPLVSERALDTYLVRWGVHTLYGLMLSELREKLEAFFKNRNPWPQTRLHHLLADARLPQYPADQASPSTAHSLRSHLLRVLIPEVLISCKDTLLTTNRRYGIPHLFDELGVQSSRILVTYGAGDAPWPVSSLFGVPQCSIGNGTRTTLLITTTDRTYVDTKLALDSSVVVDIGQGLDRFSNRSLSGHNSWYVRADPFQLQRTDARGRVTTYFSSCVPQHPPLYTYLMQLLDRCHDPKTVFSHYGPMPGPAIWEHLSRLMHEQPVPNIESILPGGRA